MTRSGAPVAVIAPPKARLVTAARFAELISAAPPPDDEFADDLCELRRTVEAPDDFERVSGLRVVEPSA